MRVTRNLLSEEAAEVLGHFIRIGLIYNRYARTMFIDGVACFCVLLNSGWYGAHRAAPATIVKAKIWFKNEMFYV